jgi:hypothetical protein
MQDLVRSALHWLAALPGGSARAPWSATLASSRFARRVLDTLFRGRARRRVAELDQLSLARAQNRTLRGLVHRAGPTRFGRDHDFRRIRDAGDFRRLVPLRTPAELWREYWQPAFPVLSGATWPGPVSYLAVSQGPFSYVPVTPELLASQQTAALTALAFVLHARPRARLAAGHLCLVGDGSTFCPAGQPGSTHSLEAVAIRHLPPLLRAYPLLSLEAGEPGEEQLLVDLAVRSVRLPVTCLAGSSDRLSRFAAHVRRITGRERLREVWPGLAVVLAGRTPRSVTPPSRSALLGLERKGDRSAPLLLDMVLGAEGALALEDPVHRRLRLLPDHGVYFEFIPADQLGKPAPARYSAAEVKPGVPYAVAVSSPAGVWACLVGTVVSFERLDPPLLRLVDTERWGQRVLTVPDATPFTAAHAYPAQPPHPRNGDNGAGRPGRPLRTASSARADRG